MELNAKAFYAFWNAEDLVAHETSNKLHYRVIGGYKFQFRVVDYRSRTDMGLKVVSLVKYFEPLFKVAKNFQQTEGLKSEGEIIDAENANTELMMTVLPDMLGLLAESDIQDILQLLIATVHVDAGNGAFEPLSNDAVAEKIFGEDLTLQLPVAATAAEVNLAGFFGRMMGGFSSLPFGIRQ